MNILGYFTRHKRPFQRPAFGKGSIPSPLFKWTQALWTAPQAWKHLPRPRLCSGNELRHIVQFNFVLLSFLILIWKSLLDVCGGSGVWEIKRAPLDQLTLFLGIFENERRGWSVVQQERVCLTGRVYHAQCLRLRPSAAKPNKGPKIRSYSLHLHVWDKLPSPETFYGPWLLNSQAI